MENLSSNTPFVIIATTIITALSAIIVAKISASANRHSRVKKVKDFAGYEAYIDYLKDELKTTKKDFGARMELMDKRVDELDRELTIEREIAKRYRSKLLEISHTHGIDVSGVLQ